MRRAWKSTRFPGVRYNEHPSRKHGLRRDRYFSIRYQQDGERKEEGLGWASEGWTEERAYQQLVELKQAATIGKGPRRLKESRAIENKRREAEKARLEAESRNRLTFGEFFTSTYLPHARTEKKYGSYKTEEGLYSNWMAATLAEKPLSEISPIDLERIKKLMFDAGRSGRSVKYCMATIRLVYNYARDLGMFAGENPVARVKLPSENNQRLRYLTREEANRLLDALAQKSLQTHEIALLSLHSGMRAGEIFSLTWGDVDLRLGQLTLRNTKNGRTRIAFLTRIAKEMLSNKYTGQAANELVFKNRMGGKIPEVSNVFERTVKELGFNKGIDDRRQKVVFHTLRHTYASWLVEAGTDIYVVGKLLGHRDVQMTQRYAHLNDSELVRATDRLELIMDAVDSHENRIRVFPGAESDSKF